MTPQIFENRKTESLTGWLWLPLGFLLLVPVLGHTPIIPWKMSDWPLLERAIPIAWLLVAAGAALLMRVSKASIPLAALLLWCFVRTAINGMQMRSLHILLLFTFVALLYVVARGMDYQKVRLFTWALAAGVAVELVLGWMNLFKIYPWMSWVVPDQIGRPMGLLTHPNYWGSLMALVLPIMWALAGPLAVIAIMIPVVLSYSSGPVISALAGIAVAAWPELGKRTKYAMVAGASAITAWVMTVHEWRLSGRREVWQAIWPEVIRYPFMGQGLGDWRVWADQYNAKESAIQGKPIVFATLQAHNEPYQLLFELGLIGVAIAAVWALQAGVCAKFAWAATSAKRGAGWWKHPISLERAWIAVLVAAVVNSLGSPTFHLPAQAALAIFALARVQATACAWSTFDKLTSTVEKLPARAKKKTVAARSTT
jgi:hypothetical protein